MPGRISHEHEELRKANYNACVKRIFRPHENLMILRILPDGPMPLFSPGQFTVLGLGSWERYIGESSQVTADRSLKLIKRAYSISCSLLDDAGQLTRASDCPYLEFYIALVPPAEGRGPMLTPRLFCLREGDRLCCGPLVRGRYTLRGVTPTTNVVFASTGTGEAPHNAMLAELLSAKHQGQILSVVCARRQRDLAYAAAHRALECRHANYRYLTLTTRESVNLDPQARGFVGKLYLQDYLRSGKMEQDAGWKASPADTHVFLCGNPQMIGAPPLGKANDEHAVSGMVEILMHRGFTLDSKSMAGNIHFEKYW